MSKEKRQARKDARMQRKIERQIEKDNNSKLGFLREFKTFITRGNVIDMAVGVVIGGAFTKIVNSVVNDIISPCISMVTGKVSLVDRVVTLVPAVVDAEGVVTKAAVAIRYGQLFQYIIDFLLTAFCIFLVMRIIIGARKKQDDFKAAVEAEKAAIAAKNAPPAPPAAPPEPSDEVKLLTEISEKLGKLCEDKESK